MIVVDTNVLAYLLLPGPKTELAEALLDPKDIEKLDASDADRICSGRAIAAFFSAVSRI